ncbi:keratin-associated protein 5-4-like [Mytilus trossulus]|uniref:keratin-associated protein 5-4-like n=1 Tax=Mytilus trossulus TaxID=6551 RepID=UPI0030072E5F
MYTTFLLVLMLVASCSGNGGDTRCTKANGFCFDMNQETCRTTESPNLCCGAQRSCCINDCQNDVACTCEDECSEGSSQSGTCCDGKKCCRDTCNDDWCADAGGVCDSSCGGQTPHQVGDCCGGNKCCNQDQPCEELGGTCQFASEDNCNGGFLNGFCATPNHKCCKLCGHECGGTCKPSNQCAGTDMGQSSCCKNNKCCVE